MTIANDDAGAAGAAFATEQLRLAMVQPAAAVIVSGGQKYRFLPIAYTAHAVIPLLEVAA
ncbi:hypothetical protein ACH37Y_06245 [Sphingomonas paucimobilis]|uniref:hypothetical protein n=1 Tax=Sphingomonas paucimobilis TaxID=13689 RepID=UPI003794C249